MIVFQNIFKTGNPVIDALITTFFLSLLSYAYQWASHHVSMDSCKEMLFSRYWAPNTVEFEGTVVTMQSCYFDSFVSNFMFSKRFTSIWHHIMLTLAENKSIHHIKEVLNYSPSSRNRAEVNEGVFIVNQVGNFLLSKELEIYASATTTNVVNVQDKECRRKNEIDTNIIRITLFSYKSNVKVMNAFVDKLVADREQWIERERLNKKYIYTLESPSITDKDNSNLLVDQWNETQFISTRSFANLFFPRKDELLQNVDFFMNNQEWYFQTGIPYSMGIGLHGPPGTGKTSLIKALANYTNRHLVVISLKLVKTRTELYNVFFKNVYNNDSNVSIPFDKKIIVFEDIDCMGSIVLDRNKKHMCSEKEDFEMPENNLIELLENVTSSSMDVCKLKKNNQKDKITLDDLLNLWDGIQETPGRMMVISSNHYDQLDPALVRPGRIDLTFELSYANHQTIREIFYHLFKEEMDDDVLQQVQEHFYSPAELINIFMTEHRNKERFLSRLVQNVHI